MIVKKSWKLSDVSPDGDLVRLLRADSEEIALSYDAGLEIWTAELDSEDEDVWDSLQLYKLQYSTDAGSSWNDILDSIGIGDPATADILDDHITATVAHGLTGGGNDVVGVTETQTLTNKTIDGSDNTLSVKPDQLKDHTDSNFPSMVVKPNSGEDTVVRFVTASSTAARIQASNAAANANRILELAGGSVKVQDKGGAAVKITNLAAATVNGDAVRYNEFNALKTAFEDSLVGGKFVGTPTVTAAMTRTALEPGRRNFPGREQLTITFSTDQDDEVNRFEIYTSFTPFTISAGETSAAELAYLRAAARSTFIRYGNELKRQDIDIRVGESLYAVVVAFDKGTGQANSASVGVVSIAFPVGQDPVRDNYEVVWDETRDISNYTAVNTNATGDASAPADLKFDTTERIKYRVRFRPLSGEQRFQFLFYIKNDPASGYVTATCAIYELGSPDVSLGSGAISQTQNAYTDVSLVDVVLANPLSVNQMYEARVSCIAENAGTNDNALREDISIFALRTREA